MDDDAGTRRKIHDLLSGGLATEAFPRADSDAEVRAILARLRGAGNDVREKLVVAGFTLAPIQHNDVRQDCETCMYYFVRRRHCVLPELDLPAEPEWSCRLWRI